MYRKQQTHVYSRRPWAACAVALLACVPAPLFAQAEEDAAQASSLETIIVTATRRGQSIQVIPQSIQAISGEEIEDLALVNIEDTVSLVPNLNLRSDRKFGGVFNIRGVGGLSDRFTQFSTVGLYLDEVPISDAIANLEAALFDIDRIEILKGPQGTLYGEGSLAGTVRIITAQPDPSEFSAKGLARVESTEDGGTSYRVAGAVNLPLAEDVAALRLTASYDDQDGYLDAAPFPAASPVNEDVDDTETSYVRAALKLAPSDALSITPSVTYQKAEYGSGPIDSEALPDLTGFLNGPDFAEDELTIYGVELEYSFANATLTSSTSYYDRRFRSTDDDILTNAVISAFFAPSPFTTQVQGRDTEVLTQELRLASMDDGAFSWLAGGFYRSRDIDSQTAINNDVVGAIFGDGRIFVQDNQAEFEQFAVFGEVTYEFTDDFVLTGGIRWFTEDISSNVDFGLFSADTFMFEEISREPDQSEDDVLFRVAASYFPGEDVQLYAQYSEGYRPGGVNDRVIDIFGVLSPAQIEALLSYEQDETRNYEIGIKSQLLDKRLTLNVSGYYIDWEGIQIDLDIPAATGLVFTDNVGQGTSVGAELELLAAPTDNLYFGILLGYASAETDGDTSTGAGTIPDGAELPFAPELNGYLFVEYARPLSGALDARFRIDASHTGSRKADIDVAGNPGFTLDEYQTFDLSLGIESVNWSATLYAKNITNELAEQNAFLFNDPIFGNALAGFVRNRPRTIGVQFQAGF